VASTERAASVPAPPVWIVDGDQWPRACLRAELIERGYDAVGFTTLEAMRTRLARRTIAPPRVVVVSVEGQALVEPALATLARHPTKVILTGGAAALAAPALRAAAADVVLPRPVSLGELADAVMALAPLRTNRRPVG
jgi:DNA-binding NtrC family response regulator